VSALGGRAPGSIDDAIVRENTDGLYASRGREFVTPDVAVDTMVLTRGGCERVARKAFEIARTRAGAPDDGRMCVTCVDKANVLRGFGDGASYFEPIHGSAPDLAGKDRANPLSMVLTAAMMLDRLGQGQAARRIREAVDAALADGAITIRPDGTVAGGTRAAGRDVAQRVH
jgi:isocitrate/isopropylmalate dehydrogenase